MTYRKRNDPPLYINARSNHPPVIKKLLPSMLSKRLSDLSCNQEEFVKASSVYTEVLRKSGYQDEILYQTHTTDTRKKTRKCNIVWFNPTFSESVKNNVRREFLRLICKHFPSHHRLHKACNRNTEKVSYSCMPNMAAIISSHNKKLLNSNQVELQNNILKCNCRSKPNCPLNGGCRERSVISKATITSVNPPKHYIGCTENEFKTRFYNHTQSLKHREKRNATELSKASW